MRHIALLKTVTVGTAFALTILAAPSAQSAFVAPKSWDPGDDNTTYNEWDVFTKRTGNAPDKGTSSPDGTKPSTLDIHSPGLVTGSNNFYAFSRDYSGAINISNTKDRRITGRSRRDPLGERPKNGTHVIVQLGTTLNGADGILGLEITDTDGNEILGAALLGSAVLSEGTVPSSFGNVTRRDAIWEFWLPDFTGDFVVNFQSKLHSSFEAARVDTFVGANAQALTIPTPGATSLALAAGGVLTSRRRR